MKFLLACSLVLHIHIKLVTFWVNSINYKLVQKFIKHACPVGVTGCGLCLQLYHPPDHSSNSDQASFWVKSCLVIDQHYLFIGLVPTITGTKTWHILFFFLLLFLYGCAPFPVYDRNCILADIKLKCFILVFKICCNSFSFCFVAGTICCTWLWIIFLPEYNGSLL